MELRTLPHTDLAVSRACFGAMTLGGQTAEADAARMVDVAIDGGINFFDTADVYNQGRSEEVLGTILKGRRSRLIVASKVGANTGHPPDALPLSRKAILANIEGSLRRLQTDYLDLYYLHRPDYATPIEETLEAMNEIIRAGKVRYFATSNYAAWQVTQILWICDKRSHQPPTAAQQMYNLLARGLEQEYIPFSKAFGVAIVAYNPLAGGLLTGKQHRDRPLAGTRFDNNRLYLDRYWHPEFFDAVDELRGVADRAGRSLIDLSLNWLLHHTATGCVLFGASKIEQLQQNLDALKCGPLSEDTVAACQAIWQKLRGATPKYNR